MTQPQFDPVFEEICFPPLRDYLMGLAVEQSLIADERKNVLSEIAHYVADRVKSEGTAKLVFVCTHNSRRSHFGQIWAMLAGTALGIQGLETFSGGTAVTALNANAASALERAGFRVHRPDGGNPAYEIAWSGRRPAMICFSKIYDDPANPRNGFGAVMTCTEADQACPIVPGAEERFSLPYSDPKSADGTPAEMSKYDERCRQIGREMVFMAGVAKSLL